MTAECVYVCSQRGRLVLYLPFLWGRRPSPLYLLWQRPPEPSAERESPLEWRGLRGSYCWCGQENKSANESKRKRQRERSVCEHRSAFKTCNLPLSFPALWARLASLILCSAKIGSSILLILQAEQQ